MKPVPQHPPANGIPLSPSDVNSQKVIVELICSCNESDALKVPGSSRFAATAFAVMLVVPAGPVILKPQVSPLLHIIPPRRPPVLSVKKTVSVRSLMVMLPALAVPQKKSNIGAQRILGQFRKTR